MHHDYSVRENLLAGIVASGEEAGVLLWIAVYVSHGFYDGSISILVQFRPSVFIRLHGPEETVSSLVSDLDPFRLYSVVLQVCQDFDGMSCKIFLHLLIGMTAP